MESNLNRDPTRITPDYDSYLSSHFPIPVKAKENYFSRIQNLERTVAAFQRKFQKHKLKNHQAREQTKQIMSLLQITIQAHRVLFDNLEKKIAKKKQDETEKTMQKFMLSKGAYLFLS
jgi:hypothetical protein